MTFSKQVKMGVNAASSLAGAIGTYSFLCVAFVITALDLRAEFDCAQSN